MTSSYCVIYYEHYTKHIDLPTYLKKYCIFFCVVKFSTKIEMISGVHTHPFLNTNFTLNLLKFYITHQITQGKHEITPTTSDFDIFVHVVITKL